MLGIERVLITGGAGFLGRYLARRLHDSGSKVTVLDDLSCSNSRFDCPQLAASGIKKVQGSVFDKSLVTDLVSKHRAVVHFASVVGVEETISRTLSTIENLNGTMNVVRALTSDHVAVFGSSADVYGAHSRLYDGPMREDDCFVFENGRVNRWVYPHVKALEENLVSNSVARSAIVRVFNCYGPDMDFPAPKRVVPQFIDSILKRQPLLLSGDGSQRRSFCYVDDMIDGFMTVLRYAAGATAPRQACFNIGHDDPISIRELAEFMVEVACEVGLLAKPLPVLAGRFAYTQSFDDTWHRTPDISHARETLGFAPAIALRDGLVRTLAHYKTYLHLATEAV